MTRNRPSVKIQPRKYMTAGLPTRYFDPGELEVLLHLYESVKAKVIVEFGVNSGRNPLATFMNLPRVEQYVGVDVERGYTPQMRCQRGEVPSVPGEFVMHDPRFKLIVKARGTFDLTAKDLPKCEAVFIDADHSRLGVENDYALARKIVRKGGIIIWHDDNCRPEVQVTETLNDLCAGGADIRHVEGTWIAYERIPV